MDNQYYSTKNNQTFFFYLHLPILCSVHQCLQVPLWKVYVNKTIFSKNIFDLNLMNIVHTLSGSYYNPCNLLRLAVVLLPSCPLKHPCTRHIKDDLPWNFQRPYRTDWQPPVKISKTKQYLLKKFKSLTRTYLHLMTESRCFPFAQQCKAIIATGRII